LSCGKHSIGCCEQRAGAQVDQIDVGEAKHKLGVESQSLVDQIVDDVEQRLSFRRV